MVIRAGYFHSAGYTEAGGMPIFLQQVCPGDDIDWIRCFPAYEKPSPKLKRTFPEPKMSESGVSGEKLVEKMLERLREHYRTPTHKLKLVMLVDDTDCRFRVSPQDFVEWRDSVEKQIIEAADDPDIRFFPLLASPEIEGWFIADWDNGFGLQDRRALSKEVHDCFKLYGLPVRGADIEGYGGAEQAKGGCTNKLSEDIVTALASPGLLEAVEQRLGADWHKKCPRALSYSKKLDGPVMLRKVQPSVIARHCPNFFGTEYKALQGFIQQLRSAANNS